MSDRFHVNPETGNPNKCTAKKACPFGGDDKHYFSKEAAHAAFEKDQGSQVKSLSKPSKALKDLPAYAQNLPNLPSGQSFAQAWTDRFKNLEEFKKANPGKSARNMIPPADTLLDEPVNALRDRGMSIITKEQYAEGGYGGRVATVTGDYVVQVSTRQGGGNRECWCDDYDNHDDYCLSQNNDELTSHPNYLSDEDDDFDSTYADFYYDAGITQKQVDEFKAKREHFARLAADEMLLEGAQEGEFTPWGVLAGSYSKVSSYKSTKTRLNAQESGAQAAEATNAKILAATKKIEKGTVTEADVTDIGVNPYRRRQLVQESKDLVAAQKKLDAVKEIQAAAEALPEDHPLRQWAIGAREERSYQTTEKKGRRNVSVTKKYTPKPRLIDDVESEQRGVDHVKTMIGYSMADTIKMKKSNDEKIAAFKTAKEAITDIRSEAWSEGWYGDPRELPEPPKDF